MASFSWMTYSLVLLFAISFVTAEVTENILSSYRDPVHPYQQVNGGEGSVKAQDCPNACANRCSETSHKKPCMFYCIECCTKCLCVPSGTYGGKEECPCYNNWKTQEGKPKCP